MATTSAVGGSQLDVQSLVSQLVAAERSTAEKQITRDTARVTTQISALGSLMGTMSTFRSALSSLKTVDVFSSRSATSSAVESFTASATSSAVPGSYDIEIEQLAKAQQLSSSPFAGGSASVVGTGTLTLAVGTKSFSIDITDSNSTLAGIRDAINSSKDNASVRATIVQGTAGARLVLSSAATGEANKIVVAQTGGNGGLSQIEYSAGATGNYTEITAAQDAIVNIAGSQSKSASNTIDKAIDGVTLTLLKATDPEEPASVSVGYDSAAVTARVKTFVTAYNALATQLAKSQKYDATTKTAGPMLGDSMVSGIESQLRRVISSPVAGVNSSFQTLANIGITTQADGTLAVDDAKLQKAMSTNFEAVGKLFGSTDGVGAKLFTMVDDRLKSTGPIETRNKTLIDAQKSIQKRQDAVDARMAVVQKAYLAQFTKLDTLLSKMQVTSSYLSQQLESMANNSR